MEQEIKLLIINPGSTSTKISIFENGVERYKKSLSHPASEVARYARAADQAPFRQKAVEEFLAEIDYDLSGLTAIVARGGSLPPIHTGAYVVNGEMIDVLRNRPIGQHASTTAAIIALDMAKRLHIPAYIYDGNTADEMEPVSRISGCPLVPRLSMGHILNTKAVGRMYAQRLGRKYEELNLIMVHLGGGISIGLHKRGVIADIMTDEEGTFSPERAGGLPSIGWARVCCSGDYTFEELSAMVRGKGGLTAYLGTNDVREVEAKVRAGDKKAALIYEAMIYQTAKCIGGLAAAADGEIDGVVLTGGIANSELLVEKLRRKVRFIAPVAVIPGEFEMEALAAGITRVLKGEEKARVAYQVAPPQLLVRRTAPGALNVSMGTTAENLGRKYHITREECDAFALESHRKAAAAQAAGRFDEQMIPVTVPGKRGKTTVVDRDECVRPESTMETLGSLPTAFEPDGVCTAGNSSPMSDGAGAVVLMDRETAEKKVLEPLAVFRGFAVTGCDPSIMGIGPVEAIRKVLRKTGLTLEEMDLIELNEAFATQSIACIRELGLDMDKVNVNGGALALGHPLAGTGAILTAKLLYELKRRRARYGLVAFCMAGGQGGAAVFERI